MPGIVVPVHDSYIQLYVSSEGGYSQVSRFRYATLFPRISCRNDEDVYERFIAFLV